MMTIREQFEQEELTRLSPRAAKAVYSKGRERPADPCPMRTDFQRDRDRIIHSKAFRRLKYKTQVFLAPEGDHYRTRLTHTLEVSQIARTIARCLRLNEDLTEAIALGQSISNFLRKQPETARNVFLRRYWYMDSIAQIADRFGMTQSKVKSMLFRTRNALRECLKKEGYTL